MVNKVIRQRNIENATNGFRKHGGPDAARQRNGNKRKTIRYKANIEKKIYEVSHFIAILSEEKLKDVNNIEKTLSWKNDQDKTTLTLEQEENVSQTHK